MTHLPSEPSDSAGTLPCSTADVPGRRLSRLAVAAIPAGVLCCPCLLSALVGPVRAHLPRALVDAGVFTWLSVWGEFTLMVAATAVPIAAVARVWASRGRRSGMALAVTGLSLSLTWWLLLILFLLTFRGWGAAPG